MRLVEAETSDQLAEIGRMFREYEAFLGVDLCFQGFEEELASLPGRYARPAGCLLLLEDEGAWAGCVAVRPIEGRVCEMKRLFVRPEHRRRGLGRVLAQAAVERAVELGYTTMRLDTLESLGAAIALYESMGFRRTAPYYDNPLSGVVYMERDL